jgi:hypothetical protein
VGLWFTNDKKEAEALLKDCHIYLECNGLSTLKDNFIIVEIGMDNNSLKI